MPKGRARKLLPKYIGPFKVTEIHPETSNYTLDLPEELKKRRLYPTFHSSLLRRHEINDDGLFPSREPKLFYDFGQPDAEEWYVDDIVGHRWTGNKIEFHVKWSLGDHTWEPYSSCSELEALDRYLELQGITDWRSLPRRSRAESKTTATRQSRTE